MRILIINPNSDENCEALLRETAEKFIGGRYEFDVVSMSSSPKLVVTYEDQYASAAELAETVRKGAEKYDAFILACHADPNYDLAKEVAGGKPVFGIAEASMHLASMKYGGYAVITPSEKIIPKKYALAHKYHVDDNLKAVIVSKGNDKDSLLEAAREAASIPNVNAIVLGCANYAGKDGYIQEMLGIPVFDGLVWALSLAEGAVRIRQYQGL